MEKLHNIETLCLDGEQDQHRGDSLMNDAEEKQIVTGSMGPIVTDSMVPRRKRKQMIE